MNRLIPAGAKETNVMAFSRRASRLPSLLEANLPKLPAGFYAIGAARLSRLGGGKSRRPRPHLITPRQQPLSQWFQGFVAVFEGNG
jgi:hypothetical protein